MDDAVDGSSPKQATTGVWYRFDVTARVQQWIANGSNNYGWIVKCENETSHIQDTFYQSDTTNAAYRPKLVITDLGGFTITAISNPTAGGTVTGGGFFQSGQQCTLSATPATAYGYTFVRWSGGPIDGSTANPASFTVTADATITAIFQGPAGYIHVATFDELRTAVTTTATPGTIIRVHPGTYQLQDPAGCISVYNAGTSGSPITVIGVGGSRPILEPAPGQEVNRGFFHLWPDDSYWVFENLEFRNLRGLDVLYSPNAAALYIQGDNVTVRNCKIHDCDQGLTSSTDAANTLVEYCEIYGCGSDLFFNYSHLMYMQDASLTVRGCYLHDACGGMCFKSRCAGHVLEYNWLENDGDGSFVANLASGNANNALWRGNVFIKRSTAGSQRRILSLHDTSSTTSGTLAPINNTILSSLAEDIYIHHVTGSTVNLVLKNNIFAGPSTTLLDWGVPYTQLSGTNNVLKTGMTVPAELVSSVVTSDPGFVNLSARDLHLTQSSPCVSAAQNNPTYLNASGQWVAGTPAYEPTKVLALDARGADSALDAGAYEYVWPMPAVAFLVASSSGGEATTPANLVVRLSQTHSSDVTVTYNVTGGSATENVDYRMPSVPTSDVIALKRDAGLTAGGVLASQFTTLTGGDVVTTTVKDARLWDYGNYRYWNYGVATSDTGSSGWYGMLAFDLSVYSGATINKAQLRIRTTNGNTAMSVAGVKSHDWAEGNKNGTYPGASPAAEGVCPAHPRGTYTSASGALGWRTNSDAFLDVTGDGADLYSFISFSSAPSGAAWCVVDITSLVQDWASGAKPNYGLLFSQGNHGYYLSEYDAAYQPVLFLDYTMSTATNTVTIPAGQLEATIPVTIIVDAVHEGSETIQVTLSDPVNAILGATTVHTYTILDNDSATVQFAATKPLRR